MFASSPKMYRAMLPGASTTSPVPMVGTGDNMLRARVPPHPRADIHPDMSGAVASVGEGISVAPGLKELPQVLVPARLREKRPGARGSNALVVFRFGHGPFARCPVGSALELVPTSSQHGVVQPVRPTPIDDYQSDLAATQTLWEVDET